jgi:PAS domain S-box-containing protein
MSERRQVPRRSADRDLLTSPQIIEKVFASLREAVFILESDTVKIRNVNQAALEMFGYSREELLGRNTDIIHVDDESLREFRGHLYQAIEERGFLDSLEFRMKRRDGTVFPTEHSVLPVEGERGKRIGWVSVVRDVTERKKAEEAFRRSEEKFSRVFRSIPDLVAISSLADGRLLYVNEGFSKITGLSYEEVIGRKSTDFDFWPSAGERDRLMRELRAEGKIIDREMAATAKSGLRMIGLMSFELLELDGEEYVLTVGKNITDRKRVELELRRERDRMQKYLDIAGVILVVIRSDQTVSLINRKGCEVLGYGERDVVGKNWFDSFIPVRIREPVRDVFEQMVGGRTGVAEHYENPVLTRDGEERIIDWHNTMLYNRGGEIEGTLSSGEDVTERKLAEQELQETAERLRALSAHLLSVREEERKAVSLEIHDELGQVLTALKMDLAMMGKRLRLGCDRELVASATEEIDSMKHLIDTTIGKLRKIITNLRPEVLDKLGFIEALRWLVREFEAHSKIPSSLEIRGPIVELTGDCSIAVFRIVQEALTNVARHSGATRMTVSLEERQGDLVVDIVDNGVGIAREKLENPSALGLLGMKERARAFGGSVDIQSTGRGGTTVTIRVPCQAGRCSEESHGGKSGGSESPGIEGGMKS